jgi:hypothetical protein
MHPRATWGSASLGPRAVERRDRAEKLGDAIDAQHSGMFGFVRVGHGLVVVRAQHSFLDELEAVLVPPLIVGVALVAGWACVLGVGLLVQWTWARWWALLTFVVVSAFSGFALFDTVRRVVDGDTTPVRHVAAPAGLSVVAVSIVLLLTREVDRS